MAIKSFKHKGLAELWVKGSRRGILPELAARVRRCLQLLDAATVLADLHAVPSLRTHKLKGRDPERWAISVNGPWRITFEWQEGNALAVDLEQYH